MNMRESAAEALKKAGVFIAETTRECVVSCIIEEAEKAKRDQYEADIIQAILMMCELNVEREKMFDLLYRYWDLRDRKEAQYAINHVMYEEYPVRRLSEYLKVHFPKEKDDFMRKHLVRPRLRTNPELSKLSVDKLKIELEKDWRK